MSLRRFPSVFLALGIIALTAAACGRAGPLEPPPTGNEQENTEAQNQNGAMMTPVATSQKQSKRPITVPDRPFFLDPLL